MPITLESLLISNFKSYRGEIRFGPLLSLSIIIGPNGSGKSNIVDAILFVMGAKPSALRVKRLRELIYGASVGKPTKESSYITAVLVIDDSMKKSFTRIINGDSSQYRINNEIVLPEIYTNNLREYGFDINLGNFIIPQNYINSIILKKPQELTAIFEQMSGSYAYKNDYDRLQLDLKEIGYEIQFTYHTKKHLLMQKISSMKEKAEAEKYSELQKQYRKSKLELQLIRLVLIKRTADILQDKLESIKYKMEESLRDKATLISSLESEKSKFKLLSTSFETAEQNILQLENNIREKKSKYAEFEGDISYSREKLDKARALFDDANKAHKTKKRNIKELKNELKQIGNKLTELRDGDGDTQYREIELSNSQIKHYIDLKNTVENRAKKFIEQIDNQMCDQQTDRNKLDNENRRKQDLQDKAKQNIFIKENLKELLKKLQSLSVEYEDRLIKREATKKELGDKIIKTRNLENDIARISKELNEVDADNYIFSQQRKRTETIKMLKKSYPGVHDRMINLCKPINSRYNVAVSKVFGKNMNAIIVDTMDIAKKCIDFLKFEKIGVETFLCLDSLKPVALKERLRNIREPAYVKLLYDVLNIKSDEINKAVFFVTQNTLICETAEHARIMAYETDKHTNYDCVSLDGCFFHKSGIISGGNADLVIKAKLWEEQNISHLREQKTKLIMELKKLPQISEMEDDLKKSDTDFKIFDSTYKYIKRDLENTENKIAKEDEESHAYDLELNQLNETISKIQYDMRKRDKEIENIKKDINAIENKIFAGFCKKVNVPDLNFFEKNTLRAHEEREKRRSELENHYDRIKNQLRLEKKRNTKNAILKWKIAMEEVDAKLSEILHQEYFLKSLIEREEENLSKSLNNCATIKQHLENVEVEIGRHRSRIGSISKLYLQSQKEQIAVYKEIKLKKEECKIIFKECKIEDIAIPLLSDATSHPNFYMNSSTDSSSLNMTTIPDSQTFSGIDFSQLPEDIRNSDGEQLRNVMKQFEVKVTEIWNQLKSIKNPNFKASKKIDYFVEQLKETNAKFRELSKKSFKIREDLSKVKYKRQQLFSNFVDGVSKEIDSIYKILVNDESAQAYFILQNPEEPYAAGINYYCMISIKNFQTLDNMSGGEQALASLTLLFAIQRYKKISFFAMDEGDAALDNVNIQNVIRYIQSQKNSVQIMLITFQKPFLYNTDALIGITIEENELCTESAVFAICLNDYEFERDVLECDETT